MKRLFASVAVVFLFAFAGWSKAGRAAAAPQPLTIEQLIDIRHPSNPAWSADSRQVTFTWDRAGVAERYVSDLDGQPPRIVPGATAGTGAGRGGRGRGAAAGAADSGVASPDGARTAFPRGNELWVRMADGRESKLAAEDARIGGISWSPDGAYVLFTAGGGPIRHEQTPGYSGAKIIYTVTENRQGSAFAVPAAGGAAVALPAGGFGARRWLDARHFIFERTSPDFKRRTTYVASVTGGEPRVLFEGVEPKFWSMTGDANG